MCAYYRFILFLTLMSFATVLAEPIDDHLLLSEAVLTLTPDEYLEIANPTGSPVSLDNYYLSDDEDYALLPGQFGTSPAPSIASSDFIAQFPVGATIAPGAVLVIAFDGAGFLTTFGFAADYELHGTDAGTPDMIAPFTGSIGSSAGLTNGGENAVLFYWDGTSDLVMDVDMVNFGTPSATNDIGDKTGVSVDGPDADTLTSTYLADAFTMPQQPSAPGSGFSTKRIALEESNEVSGGGNGITGDDETTENILATWDTIFTAPTPGTDDFSPPSLSFTNSNINKLITNTATTFDTITVSSSFIFGNINVRIDTLFHTWDADLDIFLIAPDGTSIELTTDNGSSGDDYIGTVFDQEADTSITSGTAPFTGSFRPEGDLSELYGMDIQGEWIIQIDDDAGGDDGTLQQWGLDFSPPQPDVAATKVEETSLLTMIPLSQTGSVSSLGFEGSFRNLGPTNTGDVVVEVSNQTPSNQNPAGIVFTDMIAGVTIDSFGDSTFSFSPWDASGASPGTYNAITYASSFTDTNASNDTSSAYSFQLGNTMAYDNGMYTNSTAIIQTDRSVMGTRFTLTDSDTLSSVEVLITSATTASDSFAIDLYTAVGDTPGVLVARIHRGTYGNLGTLPALFEFVIPGGMPVSPGDYYVLIDSDSSGNSNFPLGADNTGVGGLGLPHRFGGMSPTFAGGAWLFFEDAPNTNFHTLTPIIRANFGPVVADIHDFVVKSIDTQPCLVAGNMYTVEAQVQNLGSTQEASVSIELLENGVFNKAAVVSLNPLENTTVMFSYTPPDTGVFELTAISTLAGDFNLTNDTASIFVGVIEQSLNVVFTDDFSDTSFTFSNWIVIDDPTTTGTWLIYGEPFPNLYTLSVTSRGNVFSADADEAGPGNTTLSAAMLPVNLASYQSVRLDFDSDWRILDSQDTARVNVSSDGGTTWVTVLEYAGVSSRNEHVTLDLTAELAMSADAWIAFESVQPGWDWWWTIDNVCVSGASTVGVESPTEGIPEKFELTQNYPNPFNPSTVIRFGVPTQSSVSVKIYNVLGQEIATLVDEVKDAGYFNVVWNARNQFGSQIASGMYFYRLEAKAVDGSDTFRDFKKMLLLK